jgi:carbon-monoxide dehydrogenase medium subunit
MKAAPFEYSRATDIDEACGWLAADDGARVIAGGQTLVPMMAMRLARPTRLIDINHIAGLSYLREDGGVIAIGATTRQCDIERDALVAKRLPLLARAVPHIGHAATRARGTIGGSIAQADPAAELPLIAVTLGATLVYRENGATADMAAADFHIGPMVTNLPEGACLTAIRFPVWAGKVGTAFHEVNARASDFAFASAAAQVTLDANGTVSRIALGIGGVTDFAIRLTEVETQLTGTQVTPDAVRAAVRDALEGIDAMDDLQASAAYRRRTAATLAARAVADAIADAQGNAAHAY